ncbi:MAG TPA: sulfatase-like hydrolase/transferase [Eoetvoesiella sp.]|jgi:arylsulfatase A-like enzyme|uniref:sulfatase-like hydrolase/transferase n=1 Tax=Eoetvoesiella sp. TaxID=1966355 RepID=UPI002BB86F70|nr:sulfatase-like hydrolase/transferase [Eoetvoesiella sp.]HWK61889.1 sulfatase-like hydrolase/transferase [Eoetvoesiella sp.]
MDDESIDTVRNVLFIMVDRLRWDYLSCYGHPTLSTPNIDWLARHGVRFENAYVQGPLCGSSRMSYYAGRYAASHGVVRDSVAPSATRKRLGAYLRLHDIRSSVIGKANIVPDGRALHRPEIYPASSEGLLSAQLGFESYERDDDALTWGKRHACLFSEVKDGRWETAWMTDRALDFIDEQGDRPWCLHLSYTALRRLHEAPAACHDTHTADDVVPARRHPDELKNSHPVQRGLQGCAGGKGISKDDVRGQAVSAYMSQIKRLDDHLGRLLDVLADTGRLEDTMVIFCSDHGDYQGDHYPREKELFYDAVTRVPLIVYDPRESADARRGTVETRLVEAIDIVPTVLDAYGLDDDGHVLEGRSLQPLLHGRDTDWRAAVFSEMGYAWHDFARDPSTSVDRP